MGALYRGRYFKDGYLEAMDLLKEVAVGVSTEIPSSSEFFAEQT